MEEYSIAPDVRMHCLELAIDSACGVPMSADDVITAAKAFEAYVVGALPEKASAPIVKMVPKRAPDV